MQSCSRAWIAVRLGCFSLCRCCWEQKRAEMSSCWLQRCSFQKIQGRVCARELLFQKTGRMNAWVLPPCRKQVYTPGGIHDSNLQHSWLCLCATGSVRHDLNTRDLCQRRISVDPKSCDCQQTDHEVVALAAFGCPCRRCYYAFIAPRAPRVAFGGGSMAAARQQGAGEASKYATDSIGMVRER